MTTIRNASLSYGNQTIFSNITLTLPSQKWIALLGPSGVGKSSLLQLLAGILPGDHKETYLKYEAAYMAQADLLLPWLSVLNNAILGATLRGDNRKAATLRAKTLLAEVGLADVIDHYPQQLSGGMKQRVALVRTLMENKPYVLMDEPFSALDTMTRYQLHEVAANLLQQKTVLFVTHDPHEALRLAHEIYIMQRQTLKHVASIASSIPRAPYNTDLLTWQPILFHELMHE